MKYCQSTHTMIGGRIIQCEGEEGHSSAHFAEGVWWPNRHGLPATLTPDGPSRAFGIVAVAWIAAAAIVIGVVIYWVVIR